MSDLQKAARALVEAIQEAVLIKIGQACVEQEALSPAPQADYAKQNAPIVNAGGENKPKRSIVEYYKDRLVEIIIKWDNGEYFEWSAVRQKIADYQNALSASPDPEGGWQWVPKDYVIVPEEPSEYMTARATHKGYGSGSIKDIWKLMLATRPPVPKKGERDSMVKS